MAWTTIFDRTISLANQYRIYVTTLPVNDESNLGKLYRIRLETVTAIGDRNENGIVLSSYSSSSNFYFDTDFTIVSLIASGNGSGYPANTVLYDDTFIVTADTSRYGASGVAESYRVMHSIAGHHTSAKNQTTHPYLWIANAHDSSELPWNSGSVRLRIFGF